MPGPAFIVPKKRFEDFQYQIQVFGDRAEEMEPVLQRIADKILDRERRLFESRGATGGRYWRPLKATTVERKVRGGYPYPMSPLRRSLRMEKSLSQRGARDQILDIDDTGLHLATTVPYAQYHNTDTGRPPLVIPAKHAREYIKDLNDFIFGMDDA